MGVDEGFVFDRPPETVDEALAMIDEVADDLPVRGTLEMITLIAGQLYALTDHIRMLRSQGK